MYPQGPDANGHEYVDLGLPSGLLWAKCNVGEIKEWERGSFHMYGKGNTVYNIRDSYYAGTEDPLASNVDTATQIMGGQWRTPTRAEFEELLENTTHSWITINDMNGAKFTAPNGKYIFLPAAGNYTNGGYYNFGNMCYYWSSTPSTVYNNPEYDKQYAYHFGASSNIVNWKCSFNNRTNGYAIRGVISNS